MKAKSSVEPKKYEIKGDVIFLRENINSFTTENDGRVDEGFEYDEYKLTLLNRPNLKQYVENNFNKLLRFAKEREETNELNELRRNREIAFKTIDKYQLVLYYNELTEVQKQELEQYRMKWLNVTETKIIPTKPNWMICNN